jgi:hypothetical protein
VLEPAHFVSLGKMRGRHGAVPELARVDYGVSKAQADAGHKDCGHSNKNDKLSAGFDAQANDSALVSAKDTINAFEGGGIDIPDSAWHMADAFYVDIVRRMEAVIHAGGEPQRSVDAPLQVGGGRLVAEEFVQRVRRSFDLKQFVATDGAAGASDFQRQHRRKHPARPA